MNLLVGWSRVTFLGLLVLSLGLTLLPMRSGNAQPQKVLRVGLAEDPDILDPTLARTFVGRIVFASLCDKLYDIDQNLNFVPQLATSLPQLADDGKTLTITLRQGVKFHDGTPANSESVATALNAEGEGRWSVTSERDEVVFTFPAAHPELLSELISGKSFVIALEMTEYISTAKPSLG